METAFKNESRFQFTNHCEMFPSEKTDDEIREKFIHALSTPYHGIQNRQFCVYMEFGTNYSSKKESVLKLLPPED